MRQKRALVALVFAGLGAACVGAPAKRDPAKAPSPQPVAAASPARKARPSYPERKPAIVTMPMKGEPSDAALAEARLVTTSCDKVTEDVEALVKEMRAAVDQSFKEWHDEQPACWQATREDALSARGNMLRDAIGDAFGAGGLGLSGAGGGGRGEGIGLGGHAMRSPPKASRVSGTNNQIAGVDEGDIVKTDGRYMYFAANGALRIVDAHSPRVLSVTPVTGVTRELFIDGDRAVVYSSIGTPAARCAYAYDCKIAGDRTSTTISVFDITNRASPKRVRVVELSGSLMTARRIGGTVHTVVADDAPSRSAYETWPEQLGMCGHAESVVRTKLAKLKADNERRIRAGTPLPSMTVDGNESRVCDGVMRTAIRDGQAYTTVVSFDLRDDKARPQTATVQSRPGAVFASSDALYLSVVHRKHAHGRWYSYYTSVDEVSEVHKFRIGERPNETRYVASGTVPGHVLNQFAMDEWYGYLRVATTKGRVPDPRVESAVSILAEGERGNLVRVGAVEKLAPGEDIRSVRFDGDRGYVVTFKKTDPLFVMDLFDPAQPRVLGKLEIPGFSTYMHRIDRDHLLSIGFDANDHGSFASFDGILLQLFDVTSPTEPKLVHKETIGDRGSSSAAATDHLAFNYFASEGLLAIPMTICEDGGDGVQGSLAFSGLLVYDVDVERGFKRLGGVDHGTKGADCGAWWSNRWSNARSVVKRSVFLDDLVFSIADDRAKVQRLGHLGVDVADLSLTP